MPQRNASALREMRRMVVRLAPEARVVFPAADADVSDWDRVRYTWSGRVLKPSGTLIEHWAHDIAHVLVAPPERRCIPECGLGPDPYRGSAAKNIVGWVVATHEEHITCVMQTVLALLLKLDVEIVIREVEIGHPTLAGFESVRKYAPDALTELQWARARKCVQDSEGAE